MKTLTWQKPGQQNVAQELIKIIINYVAELRIINIHIRLSAIRNNVERQRNKMVFFIYQLGSLASVWAISNLIKKDVPQRIKNRIIILLLVTSWIGVLGYFFILKNRIEKWWPRKKYLVAHKWT